MMFLAHIVGDEKITTPASEKVEGVKLFLSFSLYHQIVALHGYVFGIVLVVVLEPFVAVLSLLGPLVAAVIVSAVVLEPFVAVLSLLEPFVAVLFRLEPFVGSLLLHSFALCFLEF